MTERLEVREIDGSVVRLTPDEPTQPKMPRHVVFHEQPPEPPRETESESWGRSKKYSLKWVLGISVGVATLVIMALSLLPFVNRSNAATTQPGKPTPAAVEEATIDRADRMEDLVGRAEEADQIFRKFMTAPIVDDFLPLVRDRKIVEPLVRWSRRPLVISRGWSLAKDTQWEVHTTNGAMHGRLKGRLPDYSEFTAYFVVTDRHLQLDWKATTGYGSATFDELEKQQGNPAEIRGTISPSGHYSPVFPENMFQSYLLLGPDNEKMIWCYSRRGDATSNTLGRLFHGGGILNPTLKPHKVTLRLERGPEEALPNQWLIAELLHAEWITPLTPPCT